KIMVKRAYADWNRYPDYKRPSHDHAIELIDVPQSRYSGKNSADIRMVVDAMDLAYAKQHVDTFALVSGDSDFSPLVSKLRENDRYVMRTGVKSSSSELLVGNCDEFIFYEDLIRESKKTTALRGLPEKKAESFAHLIEAIQALQRENKDTLWGSMVKQTMIRKNPAFNESYYGYSTFSKLLEEAAKTNTRSSVTPRAARTSSPPARPIARPDLPGLVTRLCSVPLRVAAGLLLLGWASATAADSPPRFTVDPTMTRGPAGAPVTIFEWSDYQCPFCREAQQVMGRLQAEFPDKIRITFK